jgi:hypothetical protein
VTVRRRRDKRWFYRRWVRLPAGGRIRIDGVPESWGLPNTRVGAEAAEMRHVDFTMRTGEKRPELAMVGVAAEVQEPKVERVDDLAMAVRSMLCEIDDLCFPEGAPNAGYVYAVRQAGGGPVKIGMAHDPVKRLLGIQCMNPHPLIVLGLAHGAANEGHLHNRHKASRLHGEWFALDENPLPITDTCLTCSAPWRDWRDR